MMDEDMPVFVPRTDISFPNSRNGLCHYNDSVMCMERIDCNKCGWNPVVARQRSYKIRKELLGAQDKD